MVLLDLFRVAIRWLHLLAAVAWVGGSIFYLLVLQPAAREGSISLPASLHARFQELVQISIITLLVTGALLTFDRLQLEPGSAYVVTLGIKVALAVWMFLLAQDLVRRARRRAIERRLTSAPPSASQKNEATSFILALGLVILVLSDVLKVIGPR